jgi:hypothetical protein
MNTTGPRNTTRGGRPGMNTTGPRNTAAAGAHA